MYEDNKTLGWVVNSANNAFSESYPFDIIKDEWSIPAVFFDAKAFFLKLF